MKATFQGVPGEPGVNTVHMYGQDFPKGEAVEINNRQARGKLSQHPFFKTEGEDPDAPQDARIKREFTSAADAALADEEARRQAEEEDAVARSQAANKAAGLTPPNQESTDGRRTDPERAGVPPSAQAAGSRQGGSGKRG